MKRYLAIIERETMASSLNAAFVTGYRRDGSVFQTGGRIGYALDYYPEEEASYRRYYGKSIIGDFASAEEAMKAIEVRFYGH